MAITFEYADCVPLNSEQDSFALWVPSGLRSKEALLAALAESGHFPGYFGHNWDALQDCLRDLSWIGNRKVVIWHNDVPLQDSPIECGTYLEILQATLADWAEAQKTDTTQPSRDWRYVEHDVCVVFPTKDRSVVERMMRSDR